MRSRTGRDEAITAIWACNMTPLILSGLLLSLIGSALGIVGAWYTASKITHERHFGFACWLINSPMIVVSLIGVGCGLWEPLAAICFVPMHTIYWFTAWRGFLNTQVREHQGCFYGCPYCSDESMGPNSCLHPALKGKFRQIVGYSSKSSQIPKGKDFPDWCPL